jgi:TnpA family transposase
LGSEGSHSRGGAERRDPAADARGAEPRWGEAGTACASDSKKIGTWDQKLMTEWRVRHNGRGVMIYR